MKYFGLHIHLHVSESFAHLVKRSGADFVPLVARPDTAFASFSAGRDSYLFKPLQSFVESLE